MTPTRRRGTLKSGVGAVPGGEAGGWRMEDGADGSGAGRTEEKPIRKGGCTAGWDGHSGTGLIGSGNSGRDGVPSSGAGFTSTGRPTGVTRSGSWFGDLCAFVVRLSFGFSVPAW